MKKTKKELIAEAIELGFKPGVSFIDLVNKETFVIAEKYTSPFFNENGDQLYMNVLKHKTLPNKSARIYGNGKWATIVKEEEEEEEVFLKDSYIVLLASCDGGDCWNSIPINYCYQLSEDSYNDYRGFSIYLDNNNRKNGWGCYNYKDEKWKKLKMRAATDEEIAEYKKIGKPYNVAVVKKNKIIGYKCPCDLFNGSIKKESLFTKGSLSVYICKSSNSTPYYIPSEIAKTWEPVYENILEVGMFVSKRDQIGMITEVIDYRNVRVKFIIGEEKIAHIDDIKILSKEEINSLSKLPRIYDYSGEYIKNDSIIKYGCAKIDYSLLKHIFDVNYNNDLRVNSGYKTINEIVLSSGKSLTAKNINDICTAVFIINEKNEL